MYTPSILPVMSNGFGKVFLSETMSCTSLMIEWSSKGEILVSKGLGNGLRGSHSPENG